jgi:hypothetical protein
MKKEVVFAIHVRDSHLETVPWQIKVSANQGTTPFSVKHVLEVHSNHFQICRFVKLCPLSMHAGPK